MTVLAVIPARLGATRLPRKPLRLLGGAPLVVRVYQHVAGLGVADRCIVATDDSEVVAACDAYDVPCVVTAVTHPSGTDRVAEAVRLLRNGRDGDGMPALDARVIVNIQGDEPFIARDAVAGAVAIVANEAAPIGTAACLTDASALANPDAVKVVLGEEGQALYFSRAAIPFLRDRADAPVRDGLVLHHIGVYAYTPAALERWVALSPHPLELCERLEQLRPLAHGMRIGVSIATRNAAGIDTESDLERANLEWDARTASHPHPHPLTSHVTT